jgi:hypothetical protein
VLFRVRRGRPAAADAIHFSRVQFEIRGRRATPGNDFAFCQPPTRNNNNNNNNSVIFPRLHVMR